MSVANVQLRPNQWLTEKQVEALTGISRSTLQKQRFKGTGFPYVKIGARLVRYSEAEVVNYMQSRQIAPDAQNVAALPPIGKGRNESKLNNAGQKSKELSPNSLPIEQTTLERTASQCRVVPVVINKTSALDRLATHFLRKRQPITTPVKLGVLFWKAQMSNMKPTAPLSKNIASDQSYDTKMMNSEMRDALSEFKEEVHSILQLPPENMAKIDHIECQLDWKPVLTARLYLKKP